MGKRLYVGNLPYDADEGALRAAFAQDGRQVQNVHLVMDRETGRPRGFAFVEMATEDDARSALTAMDGQEFGGRRLRVSEAEDRRPAGRGPGGPGPAGRGPGGRGPGGPASGPHQGGPGASRQGPPRREDGSAPRGAGNGSGDGAEKSGGLDLAPGGGATGRRSFGESEERKRVERAKPQRRKHDEDDDYGGRRGNRRFDSDDEEW